MQNLISLFLSQSLQDAWDDYTRSLERDSFVTWDYIILTASNEHQAENFRREIENRLQHGLLPQRIHFAVIPDPEGKRVGSGGATLGVIQYIVEQRGKPDFSDLKILVIHSGGDSKRVPQYSVMGKLFSPVPRILPDGRASTLFDEFIISMSSVPAHIREGMLLLSGDVLLLFNPLQIDYNGIGAAALTFKENVAVGKNHGVYLQSANGNVARFLHKQSEEMLRDCGAVNEQNCVDIDTGAVIFSKEMLYSLYALATQNREVCINESARLSLYGDFLYPLAEDSTLENYLKEKPDGDFCPELITARKAVWKTLRPYRLKLLRLMPAKFMHFGTTQEILALMTEGMYSYEELGWSKQVNSSLPIGTEIAGYNSIVDIGAIVGKGCYLEDSYVKAGSRLGDNVLLSNVDIEGQIIPSNTVLHGVRLKKGGYVVRIYGIYDNPKHNDAFLNTTISAFLKHNRIPVSEVWDDNERSLWNAKLYPVCDTMKEAVDAALNLYELLNCRGDVGRWKEAARKSLCSGFNEAACQYIYEHRDYIQQIIEMNRLYNCIREGASVKRIAGGGIKRITEVQKEWLEEKLSTSDFGDAMRLNYYIGSAMGGPEGEKYLSKSFQIISDSILNAALQDLSYNDNYRIITEKLSITLPLRVNWGGGWSDTPPYCIEHGGTVLNAAITLNGELPVKVMLERIRERKIIFDSRDMDVHGEFEELRELQNTGDPYDPFALQKAALLATGIIPKKGGNLKEILDRLGGGFVMRSEVTNVPKGSGLGTSSILSSACIKALMKFVGVEIGEEEIYKRVLCMEQIMTTGGGWQDQVGGLTGGIKYITSKPGMKQDICVEHIKISEETRKELDERYILIYTGQRRLARNLLRDVVGRYIGNESETVYALNEIQRIAALMRFELLRGNVDAFARLMREHWKLSKMVDRGSTNTLIEQIFAVVDSLVEGMLVVGAGGGGFLQAVLKKGIEKREVQERLKDTFQEAGTTVWECALYYENSVNLHNG